MIDTINAPHEKMQIIWDLGRRCTYACSYCLGHRSNTWSPMAGWDDLVKTLHFIESYCDLYDFYRTPKPFDKKHLNTISFTGGEPTINPNFFKLIDYGYKNLDDKFTFSLTTNGAFSRARAEKIKSYGMNGTISYHCEAEQKTKDLVIENILLLKNKFSVNVMFHQDYFNECVELCDTLKKEGVKFTPRVIGDSEDVEAAIKAGTAHVYTKDQTNWFKNFFGSKNKSDSDGNYSTLGRACCGGRKFCTRNSDKWTEDVSFLENTNFYNWNCFINWYFLFINSELDLVWTHQTCGVNLNNEVGPLGKISESDKILEDLEKRFINDNMPVIRCPKMHCGCGMCVTKTKDDTLVTNLWKECMRGVKPNISKHHENVITREHWFLTREAFKNFDDNFKD